MPWVIFLYQWTFAVSFYFYQFSSHFSCPHLLILQTSYLQKGQHLHLHLGFFSVSLIFNAKIQEAK